MTEFLDHIETLLAEFHASPAAPTEESINALVNTAIAPLATNLQEANATIAILQGNNAAIANQVGDLQTAVTDIATHLATGNVAAAMDAAQTATANLMAPKTGSGSTGEVGDSVSGSGAAV